MLRAATLRSITVESDDEAPSVRRPGEFDLAARQPLARRLALLQNSERRTVIPDLAATTYIYSGVIGILVAAHRNALDSTIRGASGLPRHTLRLLAIPDVFPFAD